MQGINAFLSADIHPFFTRPRIKVGDMVAALESLQHLKDILTAVFNMEMMHALEGSRSWDIPEIYHRLMCVVLSCVVDVIGTLQCVVNDGRRLNM